MLSFRLWLGETIYGSDFWDTRISPNRLIKQNCEERELEAHRYIAANTTITIPKLHKIHRRKGEKLALEMEYLTNCSPLSVHWKTFTKTQKNALVDEIAGYINQLRALEPPNPHQISSTDGNPCFHGRVGTVQPFGPFATLSDFHKLLRGNTPLEASEPVFGANVVRCHQRDSGIRFTHGNLQVRNILVRRGDATVAAIVDWGWAGWYPEYWEYTTAHFEQVFCMEFYAMLRETLGRVETRYDEELEAERSLFRAIEEPLDAMMGASSLS
jgi:hypothetical protein